MFDTPPKTCGLLPPERWAALSHIMHVYVLPGPSFLLEDLGNRGPFPILSWTRRSIASYLFCQVATKKAPQPRMPVSIPLFVSAAGVYQQESQFRATQNTQSFRDSLEKRLNSAWYVSRRKAGLKQDPCVLGAHLVDRTTAR